MIVQMASAIQPAVRAAVTPQRLVVGVAAAGSTAAGLHIGRHARKAARRERRVEVPPTAAVLLLLDAVPQLLLLLLMLLLLVIATARAWRLTHARPHPFETAAASPATFGRTRAAQLGRERQWTVAGRLLGRDRGW